MTVASNMRLFAAVVTDLQLLAVFRFATVVAVWTNGVQMHSEVSSGGRPENPKIQSGVVGRDQEFAGVPQYGWISPNQLEATNQLLQIPPQLAYDVNPELALNALYQSKSVEIPTLAPAPSFNALPNVQQIYQQPFQSVSPQTQQQFQQISRQFFPPMYPQQVAFGQVSQQLPQWTPWEQPNVQATYPQLYSQFPQAPQYWHQPHRYAPQYPPSWFPPQHRFTPVQHHRQSELQDDFGREYRNPEWTSIDAHDLMVKVEELIESIRPIDRPLPDDVRFHLFQLAARLLSRMASVGVVLISQRNNSDMDKRVDDFLHNMEDKSYQLRTMLIEMESLAAGDIAVATPPETVFYQPNPAWSPTGGYPWTGGFPIGRGLKRQGRRSDSLVGPDT